MESRQPSHVLLALRWLAKGAGPRPRRAMRRSCLHPVQLFGRRDGSCCLGKRNRTERETGSRRNARAKAQGPLQLFPGDVLVDIRYYVVPGGGYLGRCSGGGPLPVMLCTVPAHCLRVETHSATASTAQEEAGRHVPKIEGYTRPACFNATQNVTVPASNTACLFHSVLHPILLIPLIRLILESAP